MGFHSPHLMCITHAGRTMAASKVLLTFNIRSHWTSASPRFFYCSSTHSTQGLRHAAFKGHADMAFRRLRPSLVTPALRLCTTASSSSACGRPGTSDTNHTDEFPRPETIPWDIEVANRVCLIGYLGRDVELRHPPTGHIVATSSLAVENKSKNAAKPYMWFLLEFWQEMAEIAAAHLKKGQCIFVSGRVKIDTYLNKDNMEKTAYKVTVSDVKFVEDKLGKGYNLGKIYDTDSAWKTFFKNPADWWDNRNDKLSLKYPDFKHKKTGEALWIDNKSTPDWVHPELAKLKVSTEKGKNFDTDSAWKTLFENPADWWDNRNNKPSLKHPDFKHKKTGEALWIDSKSTPEWVHPELTELKVTSEQGGSMEDLWRSYLDNPADWFDNRNNKSNPKSPDFKHKKTGEALWINNRSTPEWVKEELVKLGLGDEDQNEDNEASLVRLWGSFFSDPSEWWDDRKNKKYAGAPDFRHKNTGEALWIDHRNNPPWVNSQLRVLDSAIEARGNEANSAVRSGGKPLASNDKRFTVQDEDLDFQNSVF